MLQIITGKFFTAKERHKTECKAVFFSNYSWVQPIETCIGILEPIDGGTITTWVFSYTNQIEKEEGPFSIIRTGDEEIIEQFRLLCVFGFGAYFATQRRDVEHYCRQTRVGVTDETVPSKMLSRYFSIGLHGKLEETVNFGATIEKILSLKRDRYLATMAALRIFVSALEATSTSLDLAYSMLIYGLESLAQGFDQFQPEWRDYDENVRRSLDTHLASVETKIANGIRMSLLRSSQLKLTKRFRSFLEAHTDDTFFTTEAVGIQGAIRKAEFSRAIKNAYIMRSGFVHKLRPIVSQLRIPQISRMDSFAWDREPFFTFSGLVRLTVHVLKNFIKRGESVASEKVEWRKQLPGIVTMRAAPEYWIHLAKGFSIQNASERFSGFLQFAINVIRTQKALIEMSAIMERIEQSLDAANESQKISMLCLYWVYNASLIESHRRPLWDELLKKHELLLRKCCVETVAARLVRGLPLEWNYEDCKECYGNYDRLRFGNSVTHLPEDLEIAFIVTIANKALAQKKTDMYFSYMNTAILNCAGYPEVQTFLRNALDCQEQIDCNALLYEVFGAEKKNELSGTDTRVACLVLPESVGMVKKSNT